MSLMTEKQMQTPKERWFLFLQFLFPRVGGESRGEQVFFSLIALTASYLFAGTEALFGSCPFGLALLAAAKSRVLLVFIGSVAGITVMGGTTAPIYIGLYVGLLLFRFIFSVPRAAGKIMPACHAYFHEVPQLRITAAVFGGFSAAAYQLIAGGTDTPSVLYATAMTVFVPLLTFLYLPFLECDFTLSELFGIRKYDIADRLDLFGKGASFLLTVSVGLLSSTLVLSLDGLSPLFGFSPAFTAAAFLTLFIAHRKGALIGAFAGAVSVFPISLASIPAFAVLGFAAGLLKPIGEVYAVMLALLGEGVLLAVFGGGLTGFLSAFPETLAAVMILSPLLLGIEKKKNAKAGVGDTLVCYNQNTDLEHIRRLSHAFSELSGTFAGMAKYLRKPSRSETLAIARRIYLNRCSLCEKKDSCRYTLSSESEETVKKLASAEMSGKQTPAEVFENPFLGDCTYLSDMMTDIREESAARIREKQENGTSELLSADYAMLSQILSDTAEYDKKERAEDRNLSNELCAALENQGGFHGNVTVFGSRQKQILVAGSYWEGRRLSIDEIRVLFESLCCCRLSEPIFDFSSGQMTMQTKTERRFDAEFISAGLPGGGEMSGDMIRSFENEESYFYTLLSDGMGSGRTACLTAELSGAYLGELLTAGVAGDTALKMLNQVIKQKGSECSATIDLLEVDLLYGKAVFVKSGAATSYVRRGNDVFRIRSKTIPIGLLNDVDAEKIRFDVAAGDVIVMLSDGVSQIPEDAPWLISLLTDGWDKNLPTMADKILSAARDAGRGDDMTVGLIRVSDHKCA